MARQWKCSLFSLQLATVLILLASPAIGVAINGNWNTILHQVAIRVRQPVLDKVEDYHLCSGLIVDPYFVVTTAKCLTLGQNVNGSEMYIAAGHLANDDTSNQLNYTIVDTLIHPSYYGLQGRQDIALIKVAERFPATGIVPIPNVQDSWTNCSVVVRNYDSTASEYYKLVTDIRLAPSTGTCYSQILAPGTIVGEDDYYCSQYPMEANWCDVTLDQLQSSPDLGSALICNSIFMGVLSEIQYTNDYLTFECNRPRRALALYTSLDEHQDWLYLVLGRPVFIPTDPDEVDDPDSGIQATSAIILVFAAAILQFLL